MVGQLSEPSGFAHAHTVSDASQESAECKAHQFVEPSDSALHWKVLSQQKVRWMRQVFYLKLALKRKKRKNEQKAQLKLPVFSICTNSLCCQADSGRLLWKRKWKDNFKKKSKRSYSLRFQSDFYSPENQSITFFFQTEEPNPVGQTLVHEGSTEIKFDRRPVLKHNW